MSSQCELSIIVAMARNGVIGHNNHMPWHLPDDLRRFRRLTLGHTIAMGRKTFESLPVKPLPGRKNLVISRQELQLPLGVVLIKSLEDLLQAAQNEKIFVIGGGEIYRQTLPYARFIELTLVDLVVEGDTYFPPIDFNDWITVYEEPFTDQNVKISGVYKTLERKSSKC